MIKENFKGKELEVRHLCSKDTDFTKEFTDFFNSLVEENAMLVRKTKKDVSGQEKELQESLAEIKNGKEACFVVWDNGKVAGFARIRKKKGRLSHVGVLMLAIEKDYRRLGMGKYLLNKAVEEGKKVGVKIVRIEAFAINVPAIKLYEKLGFSQVATIPKQIEYEGELIDEVILIKEI